MYIRAIERTASCISKIGYCSYWSHHSVLRQTDVPRKVAQFSVGSVYINISHINVTAVHFLRIDWVYFEKQYKVTKQIRVEAAVLFARVT